MSRFCEMVTRARMIFIAVADQDASGGSGSAPEPQTAWRRSSWKEAVTHETRLAGRVLLNRLIDYW